MNRFCFYVMILTFSSNLLGQELKLIAGGHNCAEKMKKYVIVDSQSEFNSLLNDHNIVIGQFARIDFSSEIVVAVFRGQCSSGGYGIRVNRVIQENKKYIIEVILSDPGKTCRRTMALTRPFAIYTIDKPSSEIVFEEHLEMKECN